MKRIILFSLALLMLFGFTACDGAGLFLYQNGGIQELKFYKYGDKICLNAEYLDCKAYRVERMEADDIIIKGERSVAFQDLIGENAIKVSLIETKFDKLLEDYDTFTVYNVSLDDTDLKFMLCPSAENSLYVYVGFSDNIETLKTEYTSIYFPFGTIRLELGAYK